MQSFFRNAAMVFALCATASAAPKLRLSTTTIGPIIVATGQNGPSQVVEAGNAGDGTMALTATSSASFVTTTVAPVRICTTRPVCNPVTIALNTSALARGRYTAFVTLSDPNAWDAPQTISVTVQVGSGVPDSLDLYSPPGQTVKSSFTTGNSLTASATAPAGQSLSVAGTGGGSFAFSYSYQVTASSPAGTVDGDYRGNFVTSGSTSAADNKSVPVVLHVTSLPIAEPSTDAVRFVAVQGGVKFEKRIQFANRGMGALSLTTATTNQTWVTAGVLGTDVILTLDPAGMTVGANNTAIVTVNSNSRNGPFAIPVTGELQPPGPPTAFYQGVIDNAIYAPGDPVAPGGIVLVTGEQFTLSESASTTSSTLPTNLAGATVFVNDAPVPLFYAAGSHVINRGGQITFQMPYNTPAGEARVRVDRGGVRGNTVTVQVASQVPRLMVLAPLPQYVALGIDGYAIAQLGDGAYPMKSFPGLGRPAGAGETIVFYALGLGQTTPPVTEGRPAPGAEPFARIPEVKVFFGQGNIPGSGLVAIPSFVGLTPGFVGLYQINVAVPAGLPAGDTIVSLSTPTAQGNRVKIAVQ